MRSPTANSPCPVSIWFDLDRHFASVSILGALAAMICAPVVCGSWQLSSQAAATSSAQMTHPPINSQPSTAPARLPQ